VPIPGAAAPRGSVFGDAHIGSVDVLQTSCRP